MKRLLFAVLLFASTAVFASNDPIDRVISQLGCPACHTQSQNTVGPSYTNIAKKYAGNKGAELKLIDSVMYGTISNDLPMPAQDPQGIHRTEITRVAHYILTNGK